MNSLERKHRWSWTYSQVRGIHPLFHYTGEKWNGNINCEGFLHYKHKFFFVDYVLCNSLSLTSVESTDVKQEPSCFSALHCTCDPRGSPRKKNNNPWLWHLYLIKRTQRWNYRLCRSAYFRKCIYLCNVPPECWWEVTLNNIQALC